MAVANPPDKLGLIALLYTLGLIGLPKGMGPRSDVKEVGKKEEKAFLTDPYSKFSEPLNTMPTIDQDRMKKIRKGYLLKP